MKVKKSDILPLLRATFPDYQGRRFFVEVKERTILCNLNWSEGTKRSYKACTIEGKPIIASLHLGNIAPWENQFEGKEISIPENVVLVARNFNGMSESVTFYINPINAKFLENCQ